MIVGFYTDASGKQHGFTDKGGVFTTVDDPLGVNGTVLNGINDAGQMVGYYIDGSNVAHGFVVNPTTTFNLPAGTPDGKGGYLSVISSNNVTFSDANPLAAHTITSSFDSAASSLGALDAQIGEFSAAMGHDTTGGNSGFFSWSFTLNSTDLLLLNNAGLLPYVEEVFDVNISDGHGDTTTQQISIEINGSMLPETVQGVSGASGPLSYTATASELFRLQGAVITGAGTGVSVTSTDSNASDTVVVETDHASSISVTGGSEDGISLVTAAANAVVFNAASSIAATGTSSIGILASANGNATVNDLANTTVSGDQYGIAAISEASTTGNGNVAVNLYANATVTSNATSGAYGILALDNNAGDIVVTTSSDDSITSGSAGIVAVNEDTSITNSANSVIDVNVAGTIHSGVNNTPVTNVPPAGILAGYLGSTTDPSSYPVSGLNGTVFVNDSASIYAAAGDGIRAFNYGDGNVTVNDTATEIQALDAGQTAVNGYGNGISADNFGTGSTFVTTATSTEIDSGASGIFAFNGAQTGSSSGLVSVVAHGIINSGNTPTGDGSPAAGILAGYNYNGSADGSQHGNVTIDDFATITAANGTDGIRGFNYGTGTVTITVESGVTIDSAATDHLRYGVDAVGLDGGNVSVTNHGTITGLTDAIIATTTGSGTATIDNWGTLNGDLVTSANSTITNEHLATWSLNGSNGFGGSSSLTNAGTIYSNGVSTVSGLSNFTNNGTIEVQSGSLKIGSTSGISGTGGQTGTFKVDAGATLEFSSGVSSDQNVAFEGGTGVLVLDKPSNFHGTISNFTGTAANLSSSDAIDLVGFNAAQTQVTSAVYNSGTGITAVTVADSSGHSAVLKFVGDDLASMFKIGSSSDGAYVFDPPASNQPTGGMTMKDPGQAPTPTSMVMHDPGPSKADGFVFDFSGIGQGAGGADSHLAFDALLIGHTFGNARYDANGGHDEGHNLGGTADGLDLAGLTGVLKAHLHTSDFHFV